MPEAQGLGVSDSHSAVVTVLKPQRSSSRLSA
jgi:hypothetical protein